MKTPDFDMRWYFYVVLMVARNVWVIVSFDQKERFDWRHKLKYSSMLGDVGCPLRTVSKARQSSCSWKWQYKCKLWVGIALLPTPYKSPSLTITNYYQHINQLYDPVLSPYVVLEFSQIQYLVKLLSKIISKQAVENHHFFQSTTSYDQSWSQVTSHLQPRASLFLYPWSEKFKCFHWSSPSIFPVKTNRTNWFDPSSSEFSGTRIKYCVGHLPVPYLPLRNTGVIWIMYGVSRSENHSGRWFRAFKGFITTELKKWVSSPGGSCQLLVLMRVSLSQQGAKTFSNGKSMM